MEVQIREKCPHCEQGRVANWQWQQFHEVDKRREEAGQPMFTNEEIVDWFKAQFGFSGTFNQLPCEEDYCAECEGTTILIKWIPIEQLFAKAFPIISEHWTPEEEHIHIPLKNHQGHITVSKDCPSEVVDALNKVADIAYKSF